MTYKRILQLAILQQLDIWQHAKTASEKDPSPEHDRKVAWAWEDAKTLAAMLKREQNDTPTEFQNVFH